MPLDVSGAVLAADERTVTLTTANQTPGATYRVVVSNVKDLACTANTIAANSTDYYYCAGTAANYLQRADGFVLMEAENAQRFTTSVSSPAVDWQLQTITAGYSGAGYMNVTNVRAGGGGTTAIVGGLSQGTGAKMEFDVKFTRPATNYTIWVRGVCANDGDPTGNNDSIYVGYDGNLISVGGSANNVEYSQMASWGSTTVWDWRSDSSSGPDPMVITNVTPGIHTIVIWHREDGLCLDKICIEPGVRSGAGNSTEPGAATSNGGLGDPETWDYIVAPPGGPTISISSPANGSTFTAGNLQITATVTGTVADSAGGVLPGHQPHRHGHLRALHDHLAKRAGGHLRAHGPRHGRARLPGHLRRRAGCRGRSADPDGCDDSGRPDRPHRRQFAGRRIGHQHDQQHHLQVPELRCL